MGPEFLLKAWGLLFIKLNLTLVAVGKAEAAWGGGGEGTDAPREFTLSLWGCG